MLLRSSTAEDARRNLEAPPPAELRRKVTSPGGTTQAAIDAMEAKKMGEIIVDAIQAAEERGRELGG